MAIPTTNNGTTYYNSNICRSFNQPLSTQLVALSSMVCSEVVVSNKTGQSVLLFDNNYAAPENGVLVSNNDVYTLRGITNAAQVSAQTVTGGGMLYYRTQFYSSSIPT